MQNMFETLQNNFLSAIVVRTDDPLKEGRVGFFFDGRVKLYQIRNKFIYTPTFGHSSKNEWVDDSSSN